MPKGQGQRRVLTRQACIKFGAFTDPLWRDSSKTSIAFLDAAYRGVGGDRCVFGEFQFGREAAADAGEIASAIVSHEEPKLKNRQIIALIDLMIIPIQAAGIEDLPENQIVTFVRDQCQNRGIPAENFFYDSGMRTSLVQAFSREWSTATNSIDCGGKPSESAVSDNIRTSSREYYSKFVTELWFSVRLAVESGQFRGMTEEACKEFCEREWKMTAGNKIEIESKEEMKLKTGRSPDLADAISIGLFGARQKGFTIIRAEGPNIDRRQQSWRRELREKSQSFWRQGELNHAA